MQDRLKFRALHKPTNRLFDVYGFNEHFVFENSLDGIGTSETLPAKLEDCELMQCREHKDKKGKLLFDGDILKDEMKRLFIVTPCKGSFLLQQVKLLKDGGYVEGTCYMDSLFSSEYFEIIGNIYENPELLQGVGND